MRDYVVVLGIILSIFSFTMLGYSHGNADGANEACTSIGLEWVKDKCMKVTREAV